MLRSRRRPHYGPHVCAVAAALLLLLSVSLLYSRLVSDNRPKRLHNNDASFSASFDDAFTDDPLLRDSDSDITHRRKSSSSASSDDRIDELDIVEDDSSRVSNEEEILRESEEHDTDQFRVSSSSTFSSGYYFDHVTGSIRRAFDKRSIDQLDGWDDYSASFVGGLAASDDDASKVAFGSDDIPVDEEVRRKIIDVKGIEDALLLKVGSRVSPLREGWGPWFDAKSDFLRKDRMFKSNLDMVNPLTNPLLQDPDGFGVTGLTRGDKVVVKGLLTDFTKVPFLRKKTGLENGIDNLSIRHSIANQAGVEKDSLIVETREQDGEIQHEPEIKRIERRTLYDISSNDLSTMESLTVPTATRYAEKEGLGISGRNVGEANKPSHIKPNYVRTLKNAYSITGSKYDISRSMYLDGKRWGYFPGIRPRLPFSKFMAAFFRKGKCLMRVFMVWNSPPWMYGVRHQRGLESLLFHHPDACVIVFSETVELDFFKEFVKDGFKVAVVMPNLEELLKNTPTSIFASIWHEWRTTEFYSTHNSELVRLAALYKYGGVYLDADVIVMKPILSLRNTVGMEDIALNSPLNGAVMAFRKNSSFIGECLSEFYATYDDTLLRWNGADLLTRVSGNFSVSENASSNQLELKVQHKSVFFPINSQDIARYFKAPVSDVEKAHHDALMEKILNESYTFHLWDSSTSALVPEADSLVDRVVNRHCIRCLDVL